jgi:hypothetical protein
LTSATEGELICPQCGHPNPAKADYCWECRYDFVHDARVKSKGAARTEPAKPRPIPPPYSNHVERKPETPRPQVSLPLYLIELVLSAILVGGSWKLLAWGNPNMTVVPFLLGWTAALLLVWFSEGRLPELETDVSKYWSLNPFEFRDDINRKVLDWHIMLFLPRIVFRTIRYSFTVFRGAH